LSNHDLLEVDESLIGLSGSLTGAENLRHELLVPFSEKENSYTSIVPFMGSPDKSVKIVAEDCLSRRSPVTRRGPLATIDVNSPIKSSFVKPAPPVVSGMATSRLPSIEDVDSQDSGCFPEDSKYFKYPEPMLHRRSLSDRNSSPASIRSYCSSLSAGGTQKYDGAAKLDFSFMSSGEDEGIPEELFEEDDGHLPTSITLNQLMATPLSEKATKQFSHDDNNVLIPDSPIEHIHFDFLRVPEVVAEKSRPTFRRSLSMYDNATPNARSHSLGGGSSPMNMSPVARGLFINDEDPGSSPLAPLGLHAARLRIKPSRVIQPVGGPSFKRSEPSSADSSVQLQENKRRKDDNDDRPVFKCLDNNVGNNNKVPSSSCSSSLSRLPHRIQRCHSETEATIMRALQRSTEEPDLIGDFTRPFVLPLVAGKHQDLKCITPQTLYDLMNGKFKNHVENFTIVDCRYPYEYNFGHINGARNLWTKDMVWNTFMDGKKPMSRSVTSENSGEDTKRNILVFHCEFSSERGPALSRFLRNKDRDDNKDNYPALHWPEIYLLHGGYKAFFQLFPFQDGCTPLGYLPMNQQGHEEDLRRCRAKTKSCNGDGKSGRPLTKSTSRRLEMQKL